MNDDVVLGRLLGRREAFTLMAARCSAAEAATLRDIREQKLYLNHADDWDAFCLRYLHTNKQNVNRVIRILDEFGPAYFDVAQLTRISPATYRAIAPSIRDQALHHNGQAIALIPENADQVAAAVADLRKAAPPSPPAQAADPIPALEKSCTELVGRFESVIAAREYGERVRAAIAYLQLRLDRLTLTI